MVDVLKLWVAVVAVAVEVADDRVAGLLNSTPNYLQHLYDQNEDPDLSAQ